RQHLTDGFQEVVDAVARQRGYFDRALPAAPQAQQGLRLGNIALVEREEFRDVGSAGNIREYGPHCRYLTFWVWMRGVDNVDDEVGMGRLLQCRGKRGDQ